MLGSRVSSVIGRCAAAWVVVLSLPTFAADQLDLPDLVDKVQPSVVRIDVKGAEGDGLGSGFVVDADGIVVTNHHVIAGAKEAVAVFKNGKSAKVLGTLNMDPKHDIAILRIDMQDLPVLKLAEKTPRTGESVVAFGAPQGLSFSTSEGIISATRDGKEISEMVGQVKLGTWLQTTAPISPGNSGGPLVNRNGEVVAANTLGSTAFGGQNLNFSISSLDIAEVLKQGKQKKLVVLTDGAAKSKHEHPKRKRSDLAADKIPREKIESYVKSAKDSYKDAVLEARKKLASEKKKLTDMKSGRVGNTLAMQAPGRVVIIADKGKQFYQYADESAKSKVVKKQQEEVRQVEEHFNKIQDPKTGILTYLTKAGPQVELKEIGDVGCVSEIFVTTILDADEFLAHLDDRLPVAVRGMNASKLASGHSIPGRLMYVCAMQTFGSQAGGLNIRVLRELPEEELAKHFEALGISPRGEGSPQAKTEPRKGADTSATAAPAKPGRPEFRTWSDKTGKHKIDAVLVEKTAEKVTLKLRDGKVISVELAKLSQEDLDHLRSVPEAKK